jgi:uncharacterized protein with HEPN domain
MREYGFYLKDILAAMESIQTFVKGMNLEAFQGDDKTASAVIRKFEIMGEATKQIPEEIRQKFPQVPWKEMAGMRDRLIHSYFEVDHRLIWTTVKERIPQLIPQIKRILDE